MPPRGVKTQKRIRQYAHITRSVMKREKPVRVAKRIVEKTVNTTRRVKGETKRK